MQLESGSALIRCPEPKRSTSSDSAVDRDTGVGRRARDAALSPKAG